MQTYFLIKIILYIVCILLVDTNIILDVLLNRPEFVKDSSMIWKLCETEQAKGYLSTLTYANMMYVMRKQLTPDQIHRRNFWQESKKPQRNELDVYKNIYSGSVRAAEAEIRGSLIRRERF